MPEIVSEKEVVEKLLAKADVKIGGDRPWDVQVYNDGVYKRVLNERFLGLGESYMDSWWEVKEFDQFIYRVARADLRKHISYDLRTILLGIKSVIFNTQSKSKSDEVGEHHYDIGNDLYKKMLDKRMVYTCGYWKNAQDLDKAQEDKLDLVCRKMGLKKGMKVLDIGCGWGSFVKYAAEKYGVECVGITISREQVELARKNVEGLPVEIRLQDYRDLNEKFDRIVSLGMFEHVGYKNYREFMEVVSKNLKDDGLFLLHTIGSNRSMITTNAWTAKYIFPNGSLPSIKQIGKSIEKLLVIEDLHNFGADYDPTLMAWFENFEKAWPGLKDKYNDRFYRMWKFYLLSSAGSFRARFIHLWQIVLSKKGMEGGYQSVR